MKRIEMKGFLFRLVILCSVILISACNDIDTQGNDTVGASLRISFTCSDVQENTRGIEDLNDDGTVSQFEEVIDGRRMYSLAVFLVSDGIVSASATLVEGDQRFNSENTEATISFDGLDYSKTYLLYAVANYGDYGSIASGHLSEITDITSDMSVTSSPSSYLCNKETPYPLSLKKELVLQPGVNTISGELVRTYARMRVNIRNHSELDLEVTKFQLDDNFVQSAADLFEAGGTADATPDVTSSDAITPFVPNMKIPRIGTNNSVGESTVFDAYMLESNGGTYEYTLGLKYSSGLSETKYTVDESYYITNPKDVKDGGLYIMRKTNSYQYICDNGTNTLSSSDSYKKDGKLDHNCVWRFTKTPENNYRYIIESLGRSGYFIQSSGVNNNSVPMVTEVKNDDYFTLSQTGNNWDGYYLLLQSTSCYFSWGSSNYYYYLAINNNNNVVGSTSGNNSFILYPVTTTTQDNEISQDEIIPIKTIDPETGEAVPMKKINRNDFINILVNVTYNEKSGKLEFEVSDWETVEGDVTFD